MMDINADLLKWSKFFWQRDFGGAIKNENNLNKELSEESRKPIIRKFKKSIVHSSFLDNILVVDLTNMQ